MNRYRAKEIKKKTYYILGKQVQNLLVKLLLYSQKGAI